MFARLRHLALQRLSNRINQAKIASDDWLEGEGVYTQLYLERIRAQLDLIEPKRPLEIFDGGCGVGRMTIPLALDGHYMTGVEIHKSSLDLAGREAEKAGVSCRWKAGDLLEGLRSEAGARFDVAMCVNVLYTCVQWREIIDEVCRVLKPGGLFIGTFRTRFYFVTSLLRQGQFETALAISRQSEGTLRLARVPSYYNWQTPDELRALFERKDLDVLDMRGTGLFSGSHYDGPAAITDIDTLSPENTRALFDIESADYPGTDGAGRFTFVIGRLRPSLH